MDNSRNKIVLFIVIGIAIIVGYFFYNSNQSDQADKVEEIRIGFVGALSGPASFVGIDIKRGAEIAINEINNSGGINGKKLVLISRDDEHSPKKTISLYKELMQTEKVVAMIGATNSASMLAVTPLVNNRYKIPVICPATDATAITENEAQKQGKNNFMFRVGMYGKGQANFMVDMMVKKFGFKKIGLLTWTAGWGVTGRGELNRRLKELGMTAVADETYDSGDTDMTPQLMKLKEAGAQCILNYGLVRENTFVVRTKRQLNDNTPYVSAWGISGPAFLKAASDAADGIMVSTTVTTDGYKTPKKKKFLETYGKRYKGGVLAPVFAFGAYDAVYLFKIAIKKGGVKAADIRNALEQIPSYDGLIKKFDRPVFTHERHYAITEADMILTRWTNGKQLTILFDKQGPYVEDESIGKKYLDIENSLTLKD